MKLQVEGQANQIEPFLRELDYCSNLVFKKHENFMGSLQPDDKLTVTCYIDPGSHPKRRLRIAQLLCRDGTEILIPLLDVMEVEMTSGTRLITGRSYDIFADNKKREP
ncbi:hypothetical protein [Thermoactinomyces mirandus]|uniref:Uncharacterized protein n=1 Tax=Thermoactinomyces mirandus TaxID=2756294 RepID=A0A7W1XQ07_9BACL|nr:hypothetical protein [Thermoactinomyces mirandus]MBA4601046.1 hypothetical protein [Thermoactinomyces mirandus]